MTVTSDYEELCLLVEDMASDIEKVENNATRAAGKRARKSLQNIKVLAQQLRLDIMDEIR